MPNREIRTIPELGITIEINYITSVKDTVDIDYFISALFDYHSKNKRYYPNVLMDLRIVIHDKRIVDKVLVPGSTWATSGGGTSGWLNPPTIEFSTDILATELEICHSLGHELGHLKAQRAGFEDSNIFKSEWNKLRRPGLFIKGIQIINDGECMAEDERLLNGPFLTNGFQRWDEKLGRYLQANECRGLRDLYLIWQKAEQFIKAGKPGYGLKSTEFVYSNVDVHYCQIKLKYSRWRRFLWWQWEEIISFQLDRNNI